MLESYLKSGLESNLSFKNEVKSILSIQQGQRYGFILEIESPMGKYFCPIEAYKTKEQALWKLREMLKK